MAHPRPVPTALVACLLTLALPALATAQAFTIEAVVLEGDDVPGVGLVTRIDNLAVNDAGSWLVEADTDNPDSDADSVLIADGVLYLREGDPLAEPAGATLDSFDTVNLNAGGHSGWNLFLDDTGGLDDDSGVYFDTDLLIQESDLSQAPELSPGTPYIGFFEAKIADDDSILLMASVDDPAIDSSVDRALVVLTVDAAGNLLSERVVAKEGDVLPGQIEAVTDFGTGPHEFAYDDAGRVLFVADLAGDAARNAAVYLDDTLLAQEGDPSPVPGRNWSNLSSIELSLGNGGSHVYSGSLDGDSGSNLLIVKDGAKLVQEGDSFFDIQPFALTSFGSAPVLVDDAGRAVWYGDWDDPDTDVDTGLFRDQELLVQEGVTTWNGIVIGSLSGVQDGFALSDDGRYLLFEATLADGRNGAFLLTFAEGFNLAEPDPGLAGELNEFVITGASPQGEVGLLGSIVPGQTEVPGCPGLFIEMGNPRPFTIGVADEAGDLSLFLFIPGGAAGRTVLWQAYDRSACTVSNLVEYTFPLAAGDVESLPRGLMP